MSAPMLRVARTAVEAVPGQPLLYLQCEITLVSGKLLGNETFRLVSFEGKEHVSEPFEFTLGLRGDTDERMAHFSFSSLIGRPVDVAIGLGMAPEVSSRNIQVRTDEEGAPVPVSIFNGMVASFGMQEPGVYQLTMRPTLWRMTLTNDYRVHRQMSVRDVLVELCRKHRVQANFDGISAPGNMAITRVQDWLQAGESDYEFMRRLMGKAHIFFYFTHMQGQHTLVFANRASYPTVFDNERPMRYTWTSEEELGLHQPDVISQYSFQQSLGVSGVQGVFAWQEQAANVAGGVATFASFRAHSPKDAGELPFHQYRIYQYGGSNSEVKHYTLASSDALRTGNIQLSGASYCPLFRVGHQFHMKKGDLSQDPKAAVRPELAQAPFVLTEVNHRASLDGEYSNQFQATDAAGLITPLSVADTQQGAILARVVAHRELQSPGVWPYYTPDNFDDQEEAQQDSSNSLEAKGVFVLFSTDEDCRENYVWVKIPASMQSVPEVNALVLVSRANDESELPEIQTVQADGSKVVTFDEWTAHSSKGNSYSTTYGDGKSIRFGTRWSGADTDAAVEIVETAYNRKIFRDASYGRGASYSYSCSEQMEQGVLNEGWSFGSGYSNSWAKENKSFSAIGRTYSESVIGSCDTALGSTEASDADALAAVQASRNVIIGNTYSHNTTTGNAKNISVTTGDADNQSTTTGNTVSTEKRIGNTTSTSTITGDSDSTETRTGSTTSHSTVKGNTTSYNTVTGTSTSHSTMSNVHNFNATGATSTSSATGASNNNEVTGITNSNSMTGVLGTISLQGSTNSLSLTGISASLSLAGSNNSIGVTGDNNAVNVTGSSTTVNVTSASTSVEILGAGVALTVKGSMASIEISGPSINIPIVLIVM